MDCNEVGALINISTLAYCKSHIGTLLCHTNNKVNSGSLDTPLLTWQSLHDNTQDSKTIEENIKNLNTFTVKTLQEIVETEREMFGPTSLKVIDCVDLVSFLMKRKAGMSGWSMKWND